MLHLQTPNGEMSLLVERPGVEENERDNKPYAKVAALKPQK